MNEAFFDALIAGIITGTISKKELHKHKTELAKQYGITHIPTNIEILIHAKEADIPKIKDTLSSKETRTQSGVVPLAVMTMPNFCPHGKCTMCPGGPGSVFGDVPMSYTGHEPATMRGMRAGYDSYIQVFNRLEQYILMGHPVDKIDLIIMGGTFPATSKEYQETFVIGCFKAMNDFSERFFTNNTLDIDSFKEFFELPRKAQDNEQAQRINTKITALKMDGDLEAEQKRNETAKVRCIGMTIETKPDWGLLKHGNEMLRLGCTRVELGVQTLYEDVLKKVNRGHTLQETKDSIKILKDLGFKLNFHFMLGLPLMDREKDIAAMKELFDNPAYRPDMLKIYPCMVSPGTVLFNQMKRGEYTPITTAEAADRIVEGKRYIQRYCRIMRVQRDIPPKFMAAGVDKSNLRQYVDELAKERNVVCQCIRCREHGKLTGDEELAYHTMKFNASDGTDYFISADTTESDAIVGFVRMRYPSEALREEITKDSALIRELHVYGAVVPLGEKGTLQHKGTGKELMRLAEEQAKKDGKKKIVVIAGIGVREYYRKIGYSIEGPYMIKMI